MAVECVFRWHAHTHDLRAHNVIGKRALQPYRCVRRENVKTSPKWAPGFSCGTLLWIFFYTFPHLHTKFHAFKIKYTSITLMSVLTHLYLHTSSTAAMKEREHDNSVSVTRLSTCVLPQSRHCLSYRNWSLQSRIKHIRFIAHMARKLGQKLCTTIQSTGKWGKERQKKQRKNLLTKIL